MNDYTETATELGKVSSIKRRQDSLHTCSHSFFLPKHLAQLPPSCRDSFPLKLFHSGVTFVPEGNTIHNSVSHCQERKGLVPH